MGKTLMLEKYQLGNASSLRHAFCSYQILCLRQVHLHHSLCNYRLQLQLEGKQLPMLLPGPMEPDNQVKDNHITLEATCAILFQTYTLLSTIGTIGKWTNRNVILTYRIY